MKVRTFRILWVGRFASIFGSRFLDFAFPWLVLEMTGSPLAAGIVLATEQVAPIVFALPAGIWIEKLPKKSTALVSETIRILIILSLIFLILTESLSVWAFMCIALILGCVEVFFGTSYKLFLLYAVGREHLREAYNLTEGADSIASAIGPAIAGIIFLNFGAEWAIAVTALGFVVSLLTIAIVKVKEPANEKESHQRLTFNFALIWKDLKEGITYISKTKFQSSFLLINIILGFCAMSSILLITILAQQNLGLNAGQAGSLLSAMGVGAIVGVLILQTLNKYSWKYVLTGALTLSSLGGIILAVASSYTVVLIGAFLLDCGLSISFVVHASTHQINTPNRLLARVNTASLSVDGVSRLGSRLYAGGLTQLFDVRTPLFIMGIILVFGAIVAFKTNEPDLSEEELSI
nr:MFS transporter [Salimicrobium jeotgali]